jgi:hypothetical protein
MAVAVLAVNAQAQFSLTGTTYNQNFDSLGSAGTSLAGLTGWAAGTNPPTQSASGDASGKVQGAIQNVPTLLVGTGSDNTGGNYNFGSTGSGERALGSLGSASKTRLTEFEFVNNTGKTISDLAISYTGEEWRLGKTGNDTSTSQPDTLSFAYSVNGTAFTLAGSSFNFVSPTTSGTVGALDGNVNHTTNLGGTLTGINIANNATFYLRWIDPDSTGSDNGLAIDDVALTAIPEPSTFLMVGAGLIGLLAIRRRRS